VPTRTYTFTFTESINFFENQTIRGLMRVIDEVGLPLDWLLARKQSLSEGIRFHLERKQLESIKLVFYDQGGKSLSNGFGTWMFRTHYDTTGFGRVDMPVEQICQEIARNRSAFARAASYGVQLTTKPRTPLLPGWSRGKDDSAGRQETYVGKYGTSQISGTIHRR
jgi:hypothetical protein